MSNAPAYLDDITASYRKCLADADTFLQRRSYPLDDLIELSGFLREMEAHLSELCAMFPDDVRLQFLGKICDARHADVIALADEAAQRERHESGASVH